MSPLSGFGGIIPGELVQFGVYFGAILPTENQENVHLLNKIMIL